MRQNGLCCIFNVMFVVDKRLENKKSKTQWRFKAHNLFFYSSFKIGETHDWHLWNDRKTDFGLKRDFKEIRYLWPQISCHFFLCQMVFFLLYYDISSTTNISVLSTSVQWPPEKRKTTTEIDRLKVSNSKDYLPSRTMFDPSLLRMQWLVSQPTISIWFQNDLQYIVCLVEHWFMCGSFGHL